MRFKFKTWSRRGCIMLTNKEQAFEGATLYIDQLIAR